MSESILVKLFEHNNWANLQIMAACAALTDEQLDAAPQSGSGWNIRHTLTHIATAQRGYLLLLTLPPEGRHKVPVPFGELSRSVRESGNALLSLVSSGAVFEGRLRTTDGYFVEPWVVLVQLLNHATEHRKQICAAMRAQGVEPPCLDGWTFGETMNALVPLD